MPQTRYALPILLAALLAGGAVRAQQPASPRSLLTEEMTAADRRIMQEVRQSPHLMANLEYLCDMIGPRLTGSAKLRRANEWTLQKFREYGLTNAHLEGYTIPTAWTRGHASARVLEPTEQSLTIASAGWAPSTPGPVRGEVIYLDATDEAGLEKYRGRLRGAILLTRPPREIPLPAPPTVTGVPTPLPAEPVRRTEPPFPSSAFRRRLAEFVKSEGAACIFYDSGLEHSLLNMTSRGGPEPFTPGEVPAAFITSEGYRLLWRLLKRGTTRVEVEIKNSFSAGPVEVFNTVAEIPGSERPEEVVILGAHLDSWDLGTGATDNGTGSMAVLEAARAIQSLGLRPKRTLRFILFTGEEQGLVGSREYVKTHSADAARISGI
ncbi:MAG TPA: M20/M25/M40 family metallo-hydrolase, partial [Armatimonadota bacterium]|nr:M20/M25/M40 family metallo-hydrolase [Armatimonadota bacterium]